MANIEKQAGELQEKLIAVNRVSKVVKNLKEETNYFTRKMVESHHEDSKFYDKKNCITYECRCDSNLSYI